MQFDGLEFDGANLPKCLSHGVSLEGIEALFRTRMVVVLDAEINGERRLHGYGNVGRRWIFYAFTWRGRRIRPVSVRYMHKKEIRRYVEKISDLEK
jgi:uncharacterized protein